ncbi:MAG: hypothetical protein ACP5R5_05820 [Armatimonadota bacterium]
MLSLTMTGAVCLVCSCLAQGWEWPSEMNLGGFSVTGISGTVNPDGSGTAVGQVQIPGVVPPKVTLTRSARGDISGGVSMAARMSGAEIQGPFTLDAGGLNSRAAVIKLVPRSVVDATATVSTGGQFSGTGRMPLGQLNMPVKFAVSRESLSVTGSCSVQARSDTPLATYTFTGEMKLASAASGLRLTAAGSVRRTGKLSDQVSTTQVTDVDVSIATGTGTVTVEGVAVTFSFFKP